MRIDPFKPELFALQRQLMQPFFETTEDWPELTMTQGLNVHEEDGKIVVKAAVPGIPAEQLDITYEDGILHIKGRFEEAEEEKKKKKVVYRKQMISSVDYTTQLPRPIDAAGIEAEVVNGVVTIHAPIAEAAKPKKIAVKTSAKK
jgi:HSP20 family protein